MDEDIDSLPATPREELYNQFERALLQKLTERQVARVQSQESGIVERVFSRRDIENAFMETFELIGGIPRMALWANEPKNYGLFMQLLAKMLPKDDRAAVGRTLQYVSNIPHSPLSDTQLPEEPRAAGWSAEEAEDA